MCVCAERDSIRKSAGATQGGRRWGREHSTHTGLLPQEAIRLWPRIVSERKGFRPGEVCQKYSTRREECIGAVKKIAMKVEVLIIHSTRYPSKRAYVDSPRARWWRDRKLEIARVARAHTAQTSDCTHSQSTLDERWSECHNTAFAPIPTFEQCVALYTSTRVTAHATPVSMRCSATRCGVVAAVSAAIARGGGGQGGLRTW